MQTRYLTSITTTFNPLSTTRAHRTTRLFLSRLPAAPKAANGSALPVKSTILAQKALEPAKIVVGFKGGEILEFEEISRKVRKKKKDNLVNKEGEDGGKDEGAEEEEAKAVVKGKEGVLDLGKLGLSDVLEEVGRRCRVLGRKDQISG